VSRGSGVRLGREGTPARLVGTFVLSWLAFCLALVACTTTPPAPVTSREYSPGSSLRGASSYAVSKGDTLYSIAWRSGLDYRWLAAWNAIPAPYTIYPGQRLRLKPPQRSGAVARSTVAKGTQALPTRQASHSRNKVAQRRPVAGKRAAAQVPTSTRKSGSGADKGDTGILRWRWPTEGKLVQGFAANDRSRQGIKIAGTLGQPILAAEAGKIVYSGSGLIGYGRLIIIKHNKNYLSAYGHNRKILVNEGDQVARGERIGEMGQTGNGRPVLHFEIRRNGDPINPLKLLPRQG